MESRLLPFFVMFVALTSCQVSEPSGSEDSKGNSKVKDTENPEEEPSDDTTEETNGALPSEIKLVDFFGNLGKCNKDSRGKTFYVIKSKEFRYCNDSDEWELVDLSGADGEQGAAGLNSLVSVVPEAAGQNCQSGGQKILSGKDTNGNNVLDASEVENSSYSCNGLDGSASSAGLNSLVSVTSESAGSNCPVGGYKVTSGMDDNSNNALDSGEVDTTSYVCNGQQGAQGNTGASGSNGANGANGTNGTNGKNSLVKLSNESAGVNCTSEEKKIQSGVDADSSGELDAGEVEATNYVCDGPTNLLRVYDADNTAIGYYVSQINIPNPVSSGWSYNDRSKLGLIVKQLNSTKMTVYIIGTAFTEFNMSNNPSKNSTISGTDVTQLAIDSGSSVNNRFGLPIFVSSDCTGQSYVATKLAFENDAQEAQPLLLGYIPNLYFRRYSSVSNSYDFTIHFSSGTSSVTYNSYIGTAGNCVSESGTMTAYPATVELNLFKDTLAAGWYLSP